jgi:hypothetical protein
VMNCMSSPESDIGIYCLSHPGKCAECEAQYGLTGAD